MPFVCNSALEKIKYVLLIWVILGVEIRECVDGSLEHGPKLFVRLFDRFFSKTDGEAVNNALIRNLKEEDAWWGYVCTIEVPPDQFRGYRIARVNDSRYRRHPKFEKPTSALAGFDLQWRTMKRENRQISAGKLIQIIPIVVVTDEVTQVRMTKVVK